MAQDNLCPNCYTLGQMEISKISWTEMDYGYAICKCTNCGFIGKAYYRTKFDGWDSLSLKNIKE